MLVSMELIKFKELAAAVKTLNDSGLVEKQIMTVGQTKESIVKSFVSAVQAIPDDAEGNWTGPVEVAEYYEKIVVKEPQSTDKKDKTTKEKKEKPTKEKKEKVVKEKKEKEGIESRPKMLARKVGEIGSNMATEKLLEKLLADDELITRYDGHKKWIENDFKKLCDKK